MKVHLWNLIENHQPLDILEPSDEGEFKIVHTFEVNDITNIQNLQNKIFVHLSKLLIPDWAKAKRCKYCFNQTVSKEEVENLILLECSSCLRIYEFDSNIDTIPLPVPKYQFLWTNEKTPITHSIEDVNIFLPIDNGKFAYSSLNQKIKLDLTDKLEDISSINRNPTIFHDNDNISSLTEVNLFLYPDFDIILEKNKISSRSLGIYRKLFWPHITQFKDFVQDNNTFKELEKSLITEDNIIEHFNKLPRKIVLEKELSKMIIQHNQDSEEELFLIELLHLFELSKEVPYISLYISEIDERKHKVFRPFQNSDILNQWLQMRKRGRNMVLKLRFKNEYLTILLSPFNGIKIILPFTKANKTNKTIIKDIMDHVHKHLDRHNISLPPKSVDLLDFQTIYLDLFKLEMPQELDIKTLGKIAKCLHPYLIVDQVENSLNLFYIMDVDNKEMVRMDKFLWRYIKQQRGRDFEAYQDELRIALGDEFDLEGEQLDFIFRNWLRENSDQIGGNPKFFKPIKNGIFIQIVPGEVFRVHVRGIQKWKQIEEIQEFLEKFLTLAIDPPEFFKKQCKGIKALKSLKPKPLKFSKILKTNFPKLFVDNYTTHCQNERQPLVFKDKLKYENWMKEQIKLRDDVFKIKGKEYDSRVFSRNCHGLSNDKLNEYQEEFNTTNCLTIQQKIFRMKQPSEQVTSNNWTRKEIETILINLGLNTEGHYEDNIKQIQRYFSIQKRIIKENIEDINPYPNTMIIKQNQQNFYLTCPNTSKKAQDQKQIFMGFLQLDKHPQSAQAIGDEKKQWCIPCCTKKVQGRIKEKLNDFCFGLIDYEEYIASDQGGSSDYILNSNKFPLPFGRFGKLDNLLHNLFKSNKVPNNVNEITSKTFLRLGIPQSKHSFLSAVITSINFENKENKRTIQDVYEELKKKLTPKLYSSLNSGVLASLLPNLDTFKAKLDINQEGEHLFQEIWELLSLPKMLTNSGMNIIIFEKVENEIYIVCPEDQEIKHFFDNTKPSVLIYKQGNEFEPIVWLDGEKTHGLVDVETKSIEKWYENSCRLQNFPEDWTAKSMVSKKTKYQIVDAFNKVNYLIEEGMPPLPVIPSGPIMTLPSKKEFDVMSYEETLKKLPSKYNPGNVILDDDDQVIGIVVQHDLVVPVKPEKYDKDKMLKVRKDLDIYDKVNEAILRDIREYDYSPVKKSLLAKELYERIRFEFSFANKTIEEFFKENIIIKEVEKEELQKYITPNIRKLCKDHDDIHCKDGKIRLPEEYVNKFKTKLQNEMKSNRQKRREILEKDISPIIDLFRFVDSKEVRYY